MLWRVRTTLADRPGALADLAARCGADGVNILGLQIFPGVDAVTDELVLNAPETWALADVARMVEDAGGREVSVAACTTNALVDGPTNYLLSVRHVADDPSLLHEALSELLDADSGESAMDSVLATLEVVVGDETVTVRRAAPFTVTEEARATAFAGVVSDLMAARSGQEDEPSPEVRDLPDGELEPVLRLATVGDALAVSRMAQRCSAQTLELRFGAPLAGLQPRIARRLLTEGPALVAQVGDEVVGLATVTLSDPAATTLLVEDGWQGRGVGTRLLRLAARVAKARGAGELVLRSHHNNIAVTRLSAASGLSGRVRLDNGSLVLTVSLRSVDPLLQDVEGALGPRPLDPAPA